MLSNHAQPQFHRSPRHDDHAQIVLCNKIVRQQRDDIPIDVFLIPPQLPRQLPSRLPAGFQQSDYKVSAAKSANLDRSPRRKVKCAPYG